MLALIILLLTQSFTGDSDAWPLSGTTELMN